MKESPNVPAPRRAGAFSVVSLALFAGTLLVSFSIATQWTAAHLAYQARLGPGWIVLGTFRYYAPWSILGWIYGYSSYAPDLFQTAFVICAVGAGAGTFMMIANAVWRTRKVEVAITHGSARWAIPEEIEAAGLTRGQGVVLGMLPDGQLLQDDGPEHVACIAPTRSGKGVGQVIPTLLTWPGSVLVHDMKGENWALTAAWRSKFSNVIYFNPTDPDSSAHFNPLLEVRADKRQIRDVQNIADQLVDPHGKGKESHWDRTADQFLLGAILHVLHAEADKSFYGLSKFLSEPTRSFAATLNYMKACPHDRGIAHERIAAAAQAMLNKSEEERSGILSTALGFLGLYSDPIVALNTADSDFRIQDLMQAKHPMSLYIVVPDSDRLRLKPLTRMMITLMTQRLLEELKPKENRHRLLMLIDEFPRLGKMPFFSDALAVLGGYGIKVMLVMQSKSQLDAPDAHGPHNVLIESCKVRGVFTPQDPSTAQWIADVLGAKTQVRQQTTYTGARLAPWLGHIMVADQETARPLMDAAEICKMPASDMILLVAGLSPIQAKRVRYYERPELAERAALPPPALKPGHPYSYRPKQSPNPWAGKRSTPSAPEVRDTEEAATSNSPNPPMPSAPAAAALAMPAVTSTLDPAHSTDAHPDRDDLGDVNAVHQELDLLVSEEEQKRLQALDEWQGHRQRRRHSVHRHIPL